MSAIRHRRTARLGIAVVVGAVLALLLLGVSELISDERPPVDLGTGITAGTLESDIATLAPTLGGGDCPDMARPPGADQRDAVTSIRSIVREDPGWLVDSPDGTGVQIEVSEVPGVVADEIDGCVLQATRADARWTRLSKDLRAP